MFLGATLLLSATLALGTFATPITTTPPTRTLIARQTTPTSSSDIYFLTTNYITIAGETNAQVTIPGQTIAIAIPTCIQSITPDKNGYVPPGTCNALYDYYPSFAAAVVASVLFGILTVAHIFQAVKFKKVGFHSSGNIMGW